MTVQVYFPRARSPHGKPLELEIRENATIEEVIEIALRNYSDEGWLPKLDEGLDGADETRRNARLSAAGWVLRIAEVDGEVDEDFPGPFVPNFQCHKRLKPIVIPQCRTERRKSRSSTSMRMLFSRQT